MLYKLEFAIFCSIIFTICSSKPLNFNHLFKKHIKICTSLIAGGILSSQSSYASTETPSSKTYTNERYHTELHYPSNWNQQFGELSGERSLVAFVDPDDSDTSASVVFTPIPADYTKLNSFGGGKETLRQYLLPTGENVESNVINENVKGDTYTLEYVVTAPNSPQRHIISVFALRSQESVIGLTIQTKESDFLSKKQTLEAIAPTLRVDLP